MTAQKLLLALAYQGERFLGNQLQPNPLRTVQGVLLETLRLMGLDPANGKFSGRTDAGTHARWQLFQTWLPSCRYPLSGLIKRLNALLPADITVWNAAWITDQPLFCVRQSAKWRWYRYQVQFSPYPDCWLPTHIAHTKSIQLPDKTLLDACAKSLTGQHNFKPFQHTDSPVTDTTCQVYGARWQCHASVASPHNTWQFDIIADRFLYKMVRNLVGEQLAIALGQQSLDAWQDRLSSGNVRQSGQKTASANGLTLMRVYYPPCFQYLDSHTVVLQLEQELNALEFLDENLFCQAAGN